MPSDPTPPRIFISYARSDGKAQAAELRRRLKDDHGFTLWRDLDDMEGGRDWWQQIVEAIGAVEHVVLVMTPAALCSDYVRKEWRLARQEGKNVIPVIGTSDLDFSLLPRWMQKAHFVHWRQDEQWKRFIHVLESPVRLPRVPFMVEDQPEHYVNRPAEFDVLRNALRDRDRGDPVAITAALRGAGGYGKTTLARALCHDERVQDAFHDGILWVTLGQTPGDLTGRVEDLIWTLTGERPGCADLGAATARFREVLGERSLLLVIDDVWDAAGTPPISAPSCKAARTARG